MGKLDIIKQHEESEEGRDKEQEEMIHKQEEKKEERDEKQEEMIKKVNDHAAQLCYASSITRKRKRAHDEIPYKTKVV